MIPTGLALILALPVHAAPARPISQAERVIAVYHQNSGFVSSDAPALILVAWPDGHVLWSEDRIRGGVPYWAGQIEPGRVADVLARIVRDGTFADRTLSQPRYGPDSDFTTILVRDGRQELKMNSWHELAEARGRVVASSVGLVALEGQTRLQRLRTEPSDYLYYRTVWSELRALAASLIPARGRRDSGQLLVTAGVMSWRQQLQE